MGAPKGNDNAKGKFRPRISIHFSLGSERLERLCRYLEEQGEDTTNQNIDRFIKDKMCSDIDEMTKHIILKNKEKMQEDKAPQRGIE